MGYSHLHDLTVWDFIACTHVRCGMRPTCWGERTVVVKNHRCGARLLRRTYLYGEELQLRSETNMWRQSNTVDETEHTYGERQPSLGRMPRLGLGSHPEGRPRTNGPEAAPRFVMEIISKK